jgi:hypothetical protein
MKDFLLVFRNSPSALPQPSAEEMQATLKLWMDWVGGIAAQNKLVDRGNRLVSTGKVVRPGKVVTDGPYTEIKEFIAGYTIIKSASYDEAVEIAKGCPALNMGGNVEVREINPM